MLFFNIEQVSTHHDWNIVRGRDQQAAMSPKAHVVTCCQCARLSQMRLPFFFVNSSSRKDFAFVFCTLPLSGDRESYKEYIMESRSKDTRWRGGRILCKTDSKLVFSFMKVEGGGPSQPIPPTFPPPELSWGLLIVASIGLTNRLP